MKNIKDASTRASRSGRGGVDLQTTDETNNSTKYRVSPKTKEGAILALMLGKISDTGETTKSTCEVCTRVFIPSATSNPVKCGFCNASNRSARSATSDLNGKVIPFPRVTRKKPKNRPPQHPQSWGKLTPQSEAVCVCTCCNEIFNSVAAFDKHREYAKGDVHRHCLTLEEMRDKGMAISSKGFWVTREFDAANIQWTQKEAETACLN